MKPLSQLHTGQPFLRRVQMSKMPLEICRQSLQDRNHLEDSASSVNAPHSSEVQNCHILHAWVQLVERHDWIRSAGDTQYRLKGLYLTTENFDKFRLSFEDEVTAKEFAGKKISCSSCDSIAPRGRRCVSFSRRDLNRQEKNISARFDCKIANYSTDMCFLFHFYGRGNHQGAVLCSSSRGVVEDAFRIQWYERRLTLGSDENLPCGKHEYRSNFLSWRKLDQIWTAPFEGPYSPSNRRPQQECCCLSNYGPSALPRVPNVLVHHLLSRVQENIFDRGRSVQHSEDRSPGS